MTSQRTHTLPLAHEAMLSALAETRRAVPVPCRKADIVSMYHDVPAVAAFAAYESGGELDTDGHAVKLRHESGVATIVLWIAFDERVEFWRSIIRAKMPRVAEWLIEATPTADAMAALVAGFLKTEVSR